MASTGWGRVGETLGGLGQDPTTSDTYMDTMSKRARLDSALYDAKKKRDEALARENLRDALRMRMPKATEEDIRSAETLMLAKMTGEYSSLQAGLGREQQNRAREKAMAEYELGNDLDAARSLSVATGKPFAPHRATATGTYNAVTGASIVNDVGTSVIRKNDATGIAAKAMAALRDRTPQLGGGKAKKEPAANSPVTAGTGAASYPPVPAKPERIAGQVYTFPNGTIMLWTGTGWKPR
jgi:hypothetical protein